MSEAGEQRVIERLKALAMRVDVTSYTRRDMLDVLARLQAVEAERDMWKERAING